MRFVFYSHSIVSDWNHGNAHFQRGVMRELVARGHDVVALEPQDGWSRENLIATAGTVPLQRFASEFPELEAITYDAAFDHAAALSEADVVIVHEWTDPALASFIGTLRKGGAPFTLLFHDTHHRAVSDETGIGSIDLDGYDGVLAFGEVLTELYRRRGWGRRVFTWHEAADARLFKPMPEVERGGELVWVGNWGDGERAQELETYLIEPVAALGLAATVFGVRYPLEALERLNDAGILYQGWVANADVPRVFARHKVTVHVPRRPYVEALPGIPTIRMFEALACGIPLVSAPWDDAEGLFRTGRDYVRVESGQAMKAALRAILEDRDHAEALSRSGRETILARHTCAHRVDELLAILAGMGARALHPEEAVR